MIKIHLMENQKKKIVVLTGAGISAESGLGTFRDSDGLWEKHNLSKVATIDAWHKNPALVLSFYEQRRQQILNVEPNEAHHALVRLEEIFDVSIVTQNIDNLHERAGSKDILHLHGLITQGRSVLSDENPFSISAPIRLGDVTAEGHQIRPHIVWFGEEVPKMTDAEQLISACDFLIVIGTSLKVYPAAGLIHSCSVHAKKILVDPGTFNFPESDIQHIQGKASEKVPELVNSLLKQQNHIL